MKILIDIPSTGWSTTKMWANILPKINQAENVDLSVLLGNDMDSIRLENLLINYGVKCRKRFISQNFRPSRVQWFFEDLFSGVYSYSGKFDVFHSSTVRTPYFGKWKKCITIHDTIREIFPSEFGEANKYILKIRQNAVLRSDRILTVSEYSKKCILEIFNVSSEKIFVSYHGVNRIPIKSIYPNHQTNKTFSKYPFPYVLFVGNRSGYKNFNILPKALISNQDLKEVHLLIVGGGKLTEHENEYIKKLGLSGRYKHFIDIDEDVLHELYKNALVFVYPSKMEGFGLPILESQSFGCPVIASNTGPLPEVAGNGALYFDPDDYNQLSQLIETLLNSFKRKELVVFGYKNLEKFSWQNSADTIINMYLS
jgi:glycosyltransferase involved in cell wall biosynthesis